jgi:hypothetical protein
LLAGKAWGRRGVDVAKNVENGWVEVDGLRLHYLEAGEGNERHEHEEDSVEPDDAPIVTPDDAEDAVVDVPERDDDHEAEHVAEVLGPQGEQLGR